MGTAEGAWLDHFAKSNDDTRASALQLFATQYHWFSLHQVVAFSRMINTVPVTDRETLSNLASVLYDELGRGEASAVHSVMFERFASSVGVDVSDLPISADGVLPSIHDYIVQLDTFFSSDVESACAAYQFLEASAVKSYGPLAAAFSYLGNASIEFFIIHSELEPTHLAESTKIFDRLVPMNDRSRSNEVTLALASTWDRVWEELVEFCFDR